MARRHRPLSPDERKRARRALIALCCAAATAALASVVAWAPWGREGEHGHAEHEHLVAPHGGTLTSLGRGGPHDHAEAVLGPGGALTVYTVRHDLTAARAIERQLLTAWVRAAGDGAPAKVLLVPMPQGDDPAGTASRFEGRLAESLWGRELASVTVPRLAVGGGRYRVEFEAVMSPADRAGRLAAQERLYLTPGGKYGRADIEANGNTIAARKFEGHEADHDLSPLTAGWLCPVASARSEPGVAWVVAGETYRFCCSSCVDEFVRLAKEWPERIEPPDVYRKP